MEYTSAPSESAWAERLTRSSLADAAKGSAAFVLIHRDPLTFVFATEGACRLFGVGELHGLQAAMLEGAGDGPRRLRRLALDARPNAPGRLERLRFYVGRRPMQLNWRCAPVELEGELFLAAYMAAGEAEEPTAVEPAPSELPDAPVVEPVETATPEPESPRARFLWRLDETDRFGPPDPVLQARLGAHAPREGEPLAQVVERAQLNSGLTAAIAARSTFSGLHLWWPASEPGREVELILSGAPLESGGRAREFRGFGFTGQERRAAVVVKPPAPLLEAKPSGAEVDQASISDPPSPIAQLTDQTAKSQVTINEPASARAAETTAKPAAARGGDAAALASLLQRNTGAAAESAPALAIISALATLLQAKPPANRPAEPSSKPAADIVPLRPAALAAANDHSPPSRENQSVMLSSSERDAFKEIARALGANVRSGKALEEPIGTALLEEAPSAADPSPGSSSADRVALLEILPIAALVVRDGQALYANRTLLDLCGYASLEAFQQREGLRAIFRGRDAEILAAGGAAPIVAAGERLLTVDMQTHVAHWGGSPATLIAMRRSREEDHQAQLRASELDLARFEAHARDLAAALEAARDGMIRIDAKGRLLDLNRGAQSLFGYDRREVGGESFLTLFAPASQPVAAAALEKWEDGRADARETFHADARSSDGRVFPVRVDLGPLSRSPDTEYFLLVDSVAERERATRDAEGARIEAERASEAKTELLSRVSHEMRTPLHAIMGFAEVMLEERFGPVGAERYRDYLKDILASSKHVLSLANDLLDMSKIELGKLDLQFSPIDVNRIIRECVTLMQPQAARERIIMRLSLYERLPNVMVDERSLRQIMLNLMSNAVKYNEPGGQVIVSTAIDDAGAAIVRVRDTGVGMNETELALALEPFRRGPGTKGVEGAGLGLPLTKALAEANHADFAIKSRKDQGTLVEIAFPARPAAQ